jgi:hypothetical protein
LSDTFTELVVFILYSQQAKAFFWLAKKEKFVDSKWRDFDCKSFIDTDLDDVTERQFFDSPVDNSRNDRQRKPKYS